jgi:hypothetical protein
MSWAEISAQMAKDEVAIHGEPVILPTGSTVMCVAELPGVDPLLRERGSQVSAQLQIGHQVQAAIWLPTVDAAALSKNDAVMLRGTQYLIVSLTPDGAAQTRVDLMLPGSEPGPLPEWRQWR